MLLIFRITALSAFLICNCAHGSSTEKSLTNRDIVDYAALPYDKNKITAKHLLLGTHSDSDVVVDFICSDICPNYTVRVIHYNLRKDQKCSDVGGIEKQLLIPVAIAATLKTFCFPKALTENWESYIK